MRQFFKSRGYLDSIVNTVWHRSEQIDRQQVLQKSQKEKSKRIPFTITFHPHYHAVKIIVFEELQAAPKWPRI